MNLYHLRAHRWEVKQVFEQNALVAFPADPVFGLPKYFMESVQWEVNGCIVFVEHHHQSLISVNPEIGINPILGNEVNELAT